MPHAVAKNEKKKGKIHFIGTQKGDREELRVTGHLPGEAGAAVRLACRESPGGSGASGEETAWTAWGCDLAAVESQGGAQPTPGGSEPGWPFRTKQGAGNRGGEGSLDGSCPENWMDLVEATFWSEISF